VTRSGLELRRARRRVPTNGESRPSGEPAEGRREAAEALSRFFEEEWDRELAECPEGATLLGDRRHDDRLTDLSPEAIARRRRHAHEAISRLERVPRERLGEEDRVSYDLFHRDLSLRIEGERFPEELVPITQQNGIHKDFALLASLTPFETEEDYRRYLCRLSAFPVQVDQTIALLERARESRWTLPAVPLAGVPDAIRAQTVATPEESEHFRPFRSFPPAVAGGVRDDLAQEARRRIASEVVPAYRRLLEHFVGEYLPAARPEVGAWSLPDGRAYYEFKIREQTSTRHSPEEIHEIGLEEVSRIRSEKDAAIHASGFSGGFPEFVEFLRTEPRFYYATADELLRGYRDICKRIDPELPRLFGRLPRLTYGVIPTPEYEAPTSTAAYYRPGSPETGRPGMFTANTYRLDTRPKYEMEALAIHESVPGHHLQIALAQEQTDLPKFRRYGGETAFVEGWALYAEGLGEEMGFYADPYSSFGRLTYQMWRAARLVVDTGIHALKWDRERALEFLRIHLAKSSHDSEVEIDRYIVWPAQALAYKLGEMKFSELRARARRELGECFDLRAFHDAILLSGSLPLDLLEKRIDAWIETRRGMTGPAAARSC